MKETQKSCMFKKMQNKHFQTLSSEKKMKKERTCTWNSQLCYKENIHICTRRS